MTHHVRDKMTHIVNRGCEDLGAFIGGAAALLVLGSLFLLADLQSPSLLQWTGTPVPAVERGGIAYYSFHGQNYTLNVPSPNTSTSTVYLDPANPSDAMFSRPVTRWTEFAGVAGPYASAVLLLILGVARRSRRRRRRLTSRGIEDTA